MAVNFVTKELELGSGISSELVFPGIDYRETFPKIVGINLSSEREVFSSQPNIPKIDIRLQYVSDTIETPMSDDFICRALLVPSVVFWHPVDAAYSGVFNQTDPSFYSILSRAPVAVKRTWIIEQGVFDSAVPFWARFMYEIMELTALQKVQLALRQGVV